VSRRAELIVALVGFPTLLGALIWEGDRLADPLSDALVTVIAVVGMLSIGALSGRWFFSALSLGLLAGLALVDDPLSGWALVIFGIPTTAILLAAGVGMGKLARRGVWHPELAAGILAVCILVPAVAAGYDVVRPPRDVTPEDPQVVDWRAGSFDQIALTIGTPAVETVLGAPARSGQDVSSVPVGEDYYEIGGPTSFGAPCMKLKAPDETLRYQELAVFTCDAKVYGWVTTSERAETSEGVGIGDSRELVKRRYPRADCYVANEGTEYKTFPLCTVRVCEGRALYFGGEPIRSIWLIAQKIEGLDRCLAPEQPRLEGE
jgi:hypothetical protein